MDNKTIHFYRNYFLSDSECPQTEDPYRNFGSPKQTVVIGLFYFFANLFGATKIPMGVLRLGTLRIREKIISIKMDCLVILYIRAIHCPIWGYHLCLLQVGNFIMAVITTFLALSR